MNIGKRIITNVLVRGTSLQLCRSTEVVNNMRNVEIKAKVRDLAALISKAKSLSDTPCQIINQHDTFYNTNGGRLKLRKYEDGTSDLIYYERSDQEGPKLSTYEKVFLQSSSTDKLNDVLKKALGEKGVVIKQRQLFMVGQTRVHVDSVDGLGDFMELEVMLKDEEKPEDGVKIAHNLMESLGVSKDDLIAGAYRDLLENK